MLNIPRNGRIKFSDASGTPVVLVVPYTNGDWAESGDTDKDGYETETVFARDLPIGHLPKQRSGKKIKFTAFSTVASGTNTLEDWAYAKAPYESLSTTAPAGFMAPGNLYKVTWEVNIGGVWTAQRSYNYCVIKVNMKEGSPAGLIDVDIEAIACDASWMTVTTS